MHMRAALKDQKEVRKTIYMTSELVNEFRAYCLLNDLKANEQMQKMIKEWVAKQTKKRATK